MKKILYSIFALSFFSFLIVSGFILTILWKYSPDLPGYDKITNYKPNLSSRLYSSDGLLLKSFNPSDLKREFVHPEHGKVFSIEETIGVYAWHCNHHYAHIEQALKFKDKYN